MSTNLQEFRSVPLEAITFSTTRAQIERRAHFDKAGLAELADSIKSHGLVQPILVRRLTDGPSAKGFGYEVVAGERRAMAAKLAGLTEIATSVRDLTDEQVLELQLIENLQRQDLHELAEAEGYEALQQHGHTIEDMAAKVGKSKATIYARMKLLALLPEARKAYYEGKLQASTALYIARVPQQLQKQALAEITKLQGWDDNKAPMTARQAQKHIHDNYMLRLTSAGFKTEDPDLVPAAGPCGQCPKRTGNQPELFADVSTKDTCTDPTCFKAKIAAHAAQVIALAAQTGQKVITGATAKKIARYGCADPDDQIDGYVRLDSRDYERKGTFRQTLGKSFVPTLLQDPDSGKMIEVAPQADIDKAHGGKRSSKTATSYSAQERARDKKHQQDLAYRGALFLAIREARKKGSQTLSRGELEGMAQRLFDQLGHDTTGRLFKIMGWEAETRAGGGGKIYDLPLELSVCSDQELAQLIRDLMLSPELQTSTWSTAKPAGLEAMAVSVKVDPKKICAQLAAAEKAKAAAKVKKAAPAKVAKKAKSKK